MRAIELASEEGKAMASNSVASATPTGGWDNHPGNDVDDGQPQGPEIEIITPINFFTTYSNQVRKKHHNSNPRPTDRVTRLL